MPPPLLDIDIPPARPLNDALQPPPTDAAHRAPTPPPPAYSPVTPEMSTSFPEPPPNTSISTGETPYPYAPPLAASSSDPLSTTHAHPQPRLHLKGPALPLEPPQPPAPEPISLEDNPDAIALRAAMSILQMQRQQALKDMRTLDKQKTSALEDVEGFAKALAEGSLKMRNAASVLPEGSADDDDDEKKEEAEKTDGQARVDVQDREVRRGGFGQMEIPSAQNVVRMPPINWAKYHIVGESLDRLHKEQKFRPTARVPESTRKEAEIAAPYDPFVDKLDATAKIESAGASVSSIGAGAQVEGMNMRRKSGGGKKS